MELENNDGPTGVVASEALLLEVKKLLNSIVPAKLGESQPKVVAQNLENKLLSTQVEVGQPEGGKDSTEEAEPMTRDYTCSLPNGKLRVTNTNKGWSSLFIK